MYNDGGNMKKLLLTLCATLILGSFAFAETLKIAYIDSEKIMSSCKDTQEAQKLFQKDKENWEKQIQDLDADIQKLQSEYDSRKLTLTEAGKKEAETKIKTKQDDRKKLLEDIFGENGRAMQRNSELLEPIMKKLKKVIEKISIDGNYSLILDGNSGGVLWAKPTLDITESVITEMNKTE